MSQNNIALRLFVLHFVFMYSISSKNVNKNVLNILTNECSCKFKQIMSKICYKHVLVLVLVLFVCLFGLLLGFFFGRVLNSIHFVFNMITNLPRFCLIKKIQCFVSRIKLNNLQRFIRGAIVCWVSFRALAFTSFNVS